MKKNILKITLLLPVCLAGTIAWGQKKYPEPEPMRPGMSEFWLPQPPVVKPGNAQTNSAPSDAIILFDGKDLSAWESEGGSGKPAPWTVEKGIFIVKPGTGSIQTKQKFENFQLHLEWRSPEVVKGEGQGRGNSGVFCQGMYELQILDSYENETYANGMVGSLYKQTPPLVNAMRKPGEWNVYDIIYSAPIFKKDGTYRVPPTITVLLNGVLIQNHTTIRGTTPFVGFPEVIEHGAGPISLQDHGDLIGFRNIWIREL